MSHGIGSPPMMSKENKSFDFEFSVSKYGWFADRGKSKAVRPRARTWETTLPHNYFLPRVESSSTAPTTTIRSPAYYR